MGFAYKNFLEKESYSRNCQYGLEGKAQGSRGWLECDQAEIVEKSYQNRGTLNIIIDYDKVNGENPSNFHFGILSSNHL